MGLAGSGASIPGSARISSPATSPVGQAQAVPSGSTSLGPEITSTPLSLDVVLAPRDPALHVGNVRVQHRRAAHQRRIDEVVARVGGAPGAHQLRVGTRVAAHAAGSWAMAENR